MGSHGETGSGRGRCRQGTSRKVGNLHNNHQNEGAKVLEGHGNLKGMVVLARWHQSKASDNSVHSVQKIDKTDKNRDLWETDSEHGYSNRWFQRAATKVAERTQDKMLANTERARRRQSALAKGNSLQAECSKCKLHSTDEGDQAAVETKASTKVTGSSITGLAHLVRVNGKDHKGKRTEEAGSVTEHTKDTHGSHEADLRHGRMVWFGRNKAHAGVGCHSNVGHVGDIRDECGLDKDQEEAGQVLVAIVMNKAEVSNHHAA